MAEAAPVPGFTEEDVEDTFAAEPDPLESEPESDEDENADGVFSPDFVQTTGVRTYIQACERLGIIPVQQFIAMMNREAVSLKHRGIGPAGGAALFECIKVNQCIQSLDLEDNQLGLGVDVDAGGLDHICDAIASNKVLTLLDLSFNNLSSRGCAVLASPLSLNTSIAELSLRGNNMGDLGALAFAEALGVNKSVTRLDVSDNNIDEAGSLALAQLLTNCEQLRYADFSWNSIRLTGALALTDALRSSRVERLNLAWNGIGDRGAKTLADALADNRELQFLDISKNNVGEDGALSLADGIRANETLRSLQLNGNPLKDTGVGYLVQAVGVHCTVRDLGLHGVCLERSGVQLFDPHNPTGRFTIDLAKPFERRIVEAHLELDRQDEASGIDNFLSVALNGKPVEFGEGKDIQDWPLPPEGVLTYDYVSGKRVPKDARAQRDQVFRSFHHEMATSHLNDQERLVHLRTAAIAHYFTCEQARQLVGLFTYQQRADAVVILFRRCVDPKNWDAVWSLLSGREKKEISARLGDALEPYLPEDEKVRVFLTEMDVGQGALAVANPLEVELGEVWGQLEAELLAELGDELGSGAEPDSTQAQLELAAVRAHAWNNYVKLRAVFRFYASSEEREAGQAEEQLFDPRALELSLKELWHFCKVCKLADGATHHLSEIDRLFVQHAPAHQLDEAGVSMGFADWLHGLVRLAMLRRQRTGAEPRPTVAKTFEQLLKQHVLAFGQKEDSDQFRREFWAQDVQRKLEPYWYPLKSVFDRWKTVDQGGDDRTMNLKEFAAMLKTKELVDYGELEESLKMHEAIEAFYLAQSAADIAPSEAAALLGDPVENSDAELIYIEFIEAIGRCAVKSIDEDIGEEYSQMPLGERLIVFIKKLLR